MQILLLLGLVIVGAAIALIYMQKGDDDKEKGFITKILKSFMGGGAAQQNPQQPTHKTDKYEKSADGKVVYIFKNKDEENLDDDVESDDDSDDNLPENSNPDIHIVDAEIVEDDTDETDEE